MSRDLLKRRLAEGLLAFPATPFTADLVFDQAGFEAHVADLAGWQPAALVPAGGAGEIFSLSPEEQDRIVRLSVAAAAGVPVIAGVGQGVAIAAAQMRAAAAAGADGILLFPPYLVAAEQEGLAAYVEAVCRAADLPVVVYSRNNGILSPDTALRLADRLPSFIGLKDGAGDLEALVGLRRRAGDRLVLINGVPTAEIIARECFAAGIRSYSSAVFSFLPAFALRFFAAVRDGETATVDRLLADFYVPLTAIRSRKRGYAVSLVKAGLRLAGRPAGPVRPPLLDLAERDEHDLGRLVAVATAALAAAGRDPVRASG
jgi:5-dehydro-4-deoxyglucarate dehydratase